jgi:hypothetical protein
MLHLLNNYQYNSIMQNNSESGGNYRRNFWGCCNSLILATDNIQVARPVVVPADIQVAVVLDNIQVARIEVVPADIQVVPMATVAPVLVALHKPMLLQAQALLVAATVEGYSSFSYRTSLFCHILLSILCNIGCQ